MIFPPRIATKKQQEYIAILLNDCGFSTVQQRNSFLSSELGREIKFLDELLITEASQVITELRERKIKFNDGWDEGVGL
jgi:hypothetical protein